RVNNAIRSLRIPAACICWTAFSACPRDWKIPATVSMVCSLHGCLQPSGNSSISNLETPLSPSSETDLQRFDNVVNLCSFIGKDTERTTQIVEEFSRAMLD